MIKQNTQIDKSSHLGGDTNAFQANVEERQLALERYRCLKRVPEENLTLDDKLFIENFETTMYYW